MALLRREAHMAPCHLLDAATGEYNVPYLHALAKEPLSLIKGVGRTQGIIVKKGNPLGIEGVGDLVRARYVNRQRGAGTRVLLDHMLKESCIPPADINGYDREAATHMAVAALVKSDGADAGMGILSAARAMDLGFIPVGTEEYDFAIHSDDLALSQIQLFISVITGAEFREALEKMGGYTFENTGKIIEVI